MTLEKTLRQQLSNAEPGGFHVTDAGWNRVRSIPVSDDGPVSIAWLP